MATLEVTASGDFSTASDQLHDAAAIESELDDFGDDGYRQPLQTLLDSIESDSPMTPEGRIRVYRDLVNCLVGRLFSVKNCAQAPGVPIKAPIVIVGVPRTGTTALHKLLSVDPQFQGLDRWLADFPMPRPPRESWPANPFFRKSAERLAGLYAVAPDMMKMHREVPDEVDECLQVLRQSFTSIRFGTRQRLPSYDEWLAAADVRPSYRRYAKVLAMIGTGDGRRWLLKNPSHLLHLPALLEVFPDAMFIQTHRDLDAAIPSFVSMITRVRRMHEGNSVDPREVADRELQFWGRGACAALRHRAPFEHCFIDVRQADFNGAPLETVTGIYNALGLVLTPTVEAAMRARLAVDPERGHGTHRYDPETYGLGSLRIRDAFHEYAEHFGV